MHSRAKAQVGSLWRLLRAFLVFFIVAMGTAHAQTPLDSYNYSGVMGCSGPGKLVSVTNGAMTDIIQGVLSAANSTEAGCTNPGSYNNIYSLNRRVNLTLWFDCKSVTDCGGNPVNNFLVTASCTENSTYSAAAGGCVCSSGYAENPLIPNTCVRTVETNDAQKERPNECSAQPRSGNPIYPLTGAKKEFVDTGIAVGGVKLVVTYDTTGKTPADQPQSASTLVELPAFGALWKSSLHRRLQFSADLKKALLSRGNGMLLNFEGNGSGMFTAQADNPHKLASVTGGYLFTDILSGAVETYDSAGKLARIARADGSILSFTYSGDNLLSVQANDGRGVRFAYSAGGLITQIIGANGAAIAVAYDTNKNLTSLTWPDTKVQQFVYENTSFPWALTGKIDEKNARYATFAYDSDGRAISTEHAGGVNKFSVAYGTPPVRTVVNSFDAPTNTLYRTHGWQVPNGVSVTQPNGQTVGMDVVKVAGLPALSGRSQPAGSGCAASTSAMDYDAAGNVLFKDDFQGSRTCFVYDASNRETARVEGLANTVACSSVTGTGATLPAGARKITTSWHPDWAFPTQVVQPLRKSTTVYHGQPDPFNGNATASCTTAGALPNAKPVPVVCKTVEQATLSNGTVDTTVAAMATAYTYDGLGRVLSSTNPNGKTTTYAYYGSGSAYDPHIDAVTLLLHGNGANNATTVTDDSQAHRGITSVGDAKISTAQSKFGGAAMVFDGAGDYLTIPSSTDLDFGSDDFTIEMWIKTTQATSNAALLVREWGGAPYSGGFGILLNGNSSGPITIYWADYSTGSPLMVASGTGHRDGAWHHIAWTRNGNVHRLFDNGVQVATATSAVSFASANKNFTVGNDLTFGGGSRAYNGYMDDLRITKGIARYIAPFTPPAREFAHAGPNMPDTGHAAGDLQGVTNAAGHETTFNTYDPAGRVKQMTDAKGVVTDITYAPRGWVSTVATTAPGGTARTTTYTYDDAGQLTQVSQPDGTTLSYTYDAAHRLVGAADARGNTVTYTLDNAGNRIAEEARDPSGTLQRSVARSFDALNRLQQVIGTSR